MDFGSLDLGLISNLQLLSNDENTDPLIILKCLSQLIFCIIKQMSQLPFLLNNFQKEICEKMNIEQQNIHDEIKLLDERITQSHKKLKQIQKYVNSQIPIDFESNIFKASREGKLASVRWLIEKENINKNIRVENADYNLQFYEDDTPIHIATKNGHLSIVNYLIEKQNVDINIKGFYDKTPLHNACELGNLLIANYLVSNGANIEAKDEDEKTPLHLASKWGHTNVVKYLVYQGANKNAKNKNGHTPYDIAFDDKIKNILI